MTKKIEKTFIPELQEVRGLQVTNNPNLFLDKSGRLFAVEINPFTGKHYLKKLVLGDYLQA